MRRSILLLVLGASLVVAPTAGAGTFARAPIAPELGLDALTRTVARSLVGRDVFSDPYATVTVSHLDLYDRFPYVESRRYQIVSDPAWNRLVSGEAGHSLQAYDGAGTPLGALAAPHGLAVDEQDRVYVADTGNDRIVVLQAVASLDRIDLVPLYAIPGLSAPYAVAVSDAGTPYAPDDDVLYVADTGRNRVVAYALGASSARQVAVLGELGSGPGHFAGPLAVAVGRSGGADTRDVYVADAHNRRIVHLRHDAAGFAWVADAPIAADVVTALDTDQWGNLYAAAPQQGVVQKLTPGLEPLADLRADLARPRSVHVPATTVSDHRDGSVRRVGEPSAVTVDQWGDAQGVRLWSLGVAVDGLGVTTGDSTVARFTLTDQAAVTLEVLDGGDGHRLSSRALGTLAAGPQAIALIADDVRGAGEDGSVVLRVSAASSYPNGATDVAQAPFRAAGGASVALPAQALLLGNRPNPARGSTRIAFLLPRASAARIALAVFDASGRRVRTFDRPFTPGLNEVEWDGTDDRGQSVRAGLYFYRLEAGDVRLTRRMVLVR